MDLTEFISKTLISIYDGIKKANEKNDVYELRPSAEVVNFDIAVEVVNENQGGKEGGIKIKVIEGNISKISKNKESNISRINFTVGVSTKVS